MVVALIADEMKRSTLKISVSDSDSDSSNDEESGATGSEEETILGELDQDNSKDNAENNVLSEKNSSNDKIITNEGWADSVAKILGSTKPKNKKTLVLSRAKKHSDIKKSVSDVKPEFEVIGENKQIKTEVKHEEPTLVEPPVKKVKVEKPSLRVKPKVLEKDRERLLTKIATKGVVQLFNAVKNQQKSIEKDMNRSDISEAKKEKILKKFDKRTFLDTLMGQTKSIVVDEETKTSRMKNEVKAENEYPKWSALRDDFMMGAKMKDWDKESVDE